MAAAAARLRTRRGHAPGQKDQGGAFPRQASGRGKAGGPMNAVEIEEAISALAERPFDAVEFPYLFLQAFGNKETTLKRLRKGESNRSDLGGVLQTNNIHIVVAALGVVTKILAALKASPATAR